MSRKVGLTGYATYTPPEVLTGEEVAEKSGIPEKVVKEKMGLRKKHVCAPDENHCSDMCVKAGEKALKDADIDARELDMVLYHGSEYKDYMVWSAAADVAKRLGARNAFSTESYTLCAGTPIAIRKTKAMIASGDIDKTLLVSASREEDIVDYENQDSSFMFNFGSGASAMVLERIEEQKPKGTVKSRIRESAAVTDGSFSRDVVMPAGGTVNPPTEETVREEMHTLDVPDIENMSERLDQVTLDNFLSVTDDALEKSGYKRKDLNFVALTHMKRSFHETVFEELGLDTKTDGYYLDNYGHMQSVDQVVALEKGVENGLIETGDIIAFVAAGTGYTWSATVLEWI